MYELSIVLTEVGPVVEGESKKETLIDSSIIVAYSDKDDAEIVFGAIIVVAAEISSIRG